MNDSTTIDVTVICPFFNEAAILQQAVTLLLQRLETLDAEWELIVVNDGSRDDSESIVRALGEQHSRLKLVSYPNNRGRGYALRQGIAAARGAVVVTTEIDLSWGEDIVERLLAAMREHPECDMILASPHLSGGGYRNVPFKRVMFSRLGNRIIRACVSGAGTMNTGMTRAYRREMIQTMPLEEDGKEFHLEVILKAHAFGFRFAEIPSLLEWREYKLERGQTQRKSSSRVNRLIVSHTAFSLFANPIRYVWPLSAITLVAAAVFLVLGVISYAVGVVAIYSLLLGTSLALLGLVFFTLGVIAYQGHAVQREIWLFRRERMLEKLRERE